MQRVAGKQQHAVAVLLDRARTRLDEIDAALTRLEHGTYGGCERCRREIAAARLDAQPATRRCVDCATR